MVTFPPHATKHVRWAVTTYAIHTRRTAEFARELLPVQAAEDAAVKAADARMLAARMEPGSRQLAGGRDELGAVFGDALADQAMELSYRAGSLVHRLEAGHGFRLPRGLRLIGDRVGVLVALLGQLGDGYHDDEEENR